MSQVAFVVYPIWNKVEYLVKEHSYKINYIMNLSYHSKVYLQKYLKKIRFIGILNVIHAFSASLM